MARVAIELVAAGRYQAACRAEGCTASRGRPWRGEALRHLPDAQGQADEHRRCHGSEEPDAFAHGSIDEPAR